MRPTTVPPNFGEELFDKNRQQIAAAEEEEALGADLHYTPDVSTTSSNPPQGDATSDPECLGPIRKINMSPKCLLTPDNVPGPLNVVFSHQPTLGQDCTEFYVFTFYGIH